MAAAEAETDAGGDQKPDFVFAVQRRDRPHDDDGGGGGEVKQLVAYEAGFAALTARGDVLTWGDGRYAACLGREVTDARYEPPSPLLSLFIYI